MVSIYCRACLLIVPYFKLCLILLIALFYSFATGQKINYLTIRDTVLNPTCGSVGASENLASMERLKSLDTNAIGKHKYMYFEDLAVCYWKAANMTNELLLQKMINASHSALYHNPDSQRALTSLIYGFALLNDCLKAKYYLEVLRAKTPKRKWNLGQENWVNDKCK